MNGAPPPQYDPNMPPPQQNYPPQQGYPPQQQQQQVYSPQGYTPQPNVVYQQQPQTIVTVQTQQVQVWGVDPQNFTCSCGYSGLSQTGKEMGTTPWLLAFLLFFLGFFIGVTWCICWIPLIIPAFYDVVHKCPQCKKVAHRKTYM